MTQSINVEKKKKNMIETDIKNLCWMIMKYILHVEDEDLMNNILQL